MRIWRARQAIFVYNYWNDRGVTGFGNCDLTVYRGKFDQAQFRATEKVIAEKISATRVMITNIIWL